ncbi:MAG: cupin domain-containing protein [Flavobacteriales bacterium]|nr:cupin domain-containing protein [Flavobacteriales bacterium]MBK7754661.1 cupin domain-containing protein [Flavobacteriales bacterium]MBK9074590.1 cupin domain-containing protein [Flavobacteriales bacterium]
MNSSTPKPAARLADATAYDAAKLQSTMVLNNGSAKAIVFALKAGQDVPPHSSPVEALFTVLEGEATVTIKDAVNRVAAGGYIILPMAIDHHIKAVSDMKFMLLK